MPTDKPETLFELETHEIEAVAELNAVIAEIIENEGVVTPELEARHEAALERLDEATTDVNRKLNAYGHVMTEIAAKQRIAEAKLAEIKKRTEKPNRERQAYGRTWEKLKTRVYQTLVDRDVAKVDTGDFDYALVTNSVGFGVTIDYEEVPDHLYVRVPDEDAINQLIGGEQRRIGAEVSGLRAKLKKLKAEPDEIRRQTRELEAELCRELSERTWFTLTPRGEHLRGA